MFPLSQFSPSFFSGAVLTVLSLTVPSQAASTVLADLIAGQEHASESETDLSNQNWNVVFSADFDGAGTDDTTGVPAYILNEPVTGYGVSPVLRVNDDGSNGSAKVMFSHSVPDLSVNYAWTLSSLARVTSVGLGGNLSYNDNRPGASWFLIGMREGVSGNIEVWRNFESTAISAIDTGIPNDSEYHRFEMRAEEVGADNIWGTGDDVVNIYVDGIVQGRVDPRADSNALTGTVAFGSDYGNGLSDTYFKEVTFTVIPEPSSAALLGLGTVGFILSRRRR